MKSALIPWLYQNSVPECTRMGSKMNQFPGILQSITTGWSDSTNPLPSGTACVPFDDWYIATGTSSAIALGQPSGKNNCIYCRCRIFDSDRFCPACGGPIYE